MKSFQITALHFTAGGEYGHDGRTNHIVSRAAPIIRYLIGWTESSVRSYCIKKGWKYDTWESDSSSAQAQ